MSADSLSSNSPPVRESRPQLALAHRLRQWQQKQGRTVTDQDLEELAPTLRVSLSRLRSTAGFFDEFRPLSPGNGEKMEDRACVDPICAIARGFVHPKDTGSIACPGRCAEGPAEVSASGELITRGDGELLVKNLASEAYLTAPFLERNAEICREKLIRESGTSADLLDRLAAVTGLDRHRRKQGKALPDRWREAAEAEGKDGQRFLVCHANAGNPGVSGHAWLLQRRTRAVIDGMAIAGMATGAREGVICVPHDQPEVFTAVKETLEAGKRDLGIELSAVMTFGSHVGGEETALLDAIEGNRGEPRLRPPEPEQSGLFGLPTVIETAEVFALIPRWLTEGRDAGHRLITLTPPFARSGLVEVDASVSLRGASREGTGYLKKNSFRALLLGGPFGSLVFPENWDLRFDAEVLSENEIEPGNWGLTPISRETNPRKFAIALLEFASRESCGKCAPCRLGPVAALEIMNSSRPKDRQRLDEILQTIRQTSLCGFGRDFPRPLEQLIDHWGVEALLKDTSG